MSVGSIPRLITSAFCLICAMGFAGCSGPVTVSGTVVDQDGNPLDGVALHLTGASANQYEFDSYAGEASMEVEDGRFQVACGFCTAVHLFFSKEGYYSQSLDLSMFDRKRGHEIVMRRVKFPVDLRRYIARLETGPEIDDKVLSFGSSPSERLLSDVTSANVVPELPYVTLTPTVGTDGSIATKTEGGRRVPASVHLNFSTAKGGVVLFAPSTMNLRDGLKEMYVAPDVEYPASVEINLTNSHTFFYCNVAGQFCKGIVHTPMLGERDGTDLVNTHIEIHLSPYFGNRSLDDPTPY